MELADLDKRIVSLEREVASMEIQDAKSQVINEQIKETLNLFQKSFKDVSDVISAIQGTMVGMQTEIRISNENNKKLSDKMDQIAQIATRIDSVETSSKDAIKRVNERIDRVEIEVINIKNKQTTDKKEIEDKIQVHVNEQKIDIVGLGKQALVYVFLLITGGVVVWLLSQGITFKP